MSALHALQFVATAGATLFAGAALYISAVEHPARMGLGTPAAVAQWAPSYRRATWLQAPLALASLAAGAGAWQLGGGAGWLLAAVLVGSAVPFTLVGIMPTNRALLEPGLDLASAETRRLLERWGRLHAVRTALGLAAGVVYLWLLTAA